jgi:uncharacterized protein YutD
MIWITSYSYYLGSYSVVTLRVMGVFLNNLKPEDNDTQVRLQVYVYVYIYNSQWILNTIGYGTADKDR